METNIVLSIATLLAILIGPIAAVGVTLWNEKRRMKLNQKRWLFTTLVAYRKSWPPALEWVSALNQIDVIFYDVPAVVLAWRAYYDSLTKNLSDQNNLQASFHAHLDLLHEMAQHLGYPKMKQTDLDRFYQPNQFGNVSNLQAGIQVELLRVLQATDHLVLAPKDEPSTKAEVKPQDPLRISNQ